MANLLVTNVPPTQSFQLQTNNASPIDVTSVDSATLPTTDVPLSNVRYVDGGTSITPPDQNGSLAAPYGSLLTAIADPAGVVIFATPGSYTAEGTLAITRSLAINSMATANGSVTTSNITIDNGRVCQFNQINTAGTVTAGTGGNTRFDNSFIGGLITCGATSQTTFINSVETGGLDCTQLVASGGSTLVGPVNVSGTLVALTDCHFAGGLTITFTGAAGTVTMDLSTYRRFLVAGGSVVNGSIVSGDFLPPAANVAALATAAYAHIPNGQSVYVLSRFRNYVSVPIGNGDEAGTGNEWKSDASTSSPGQQTIATWFLSNAGSDDNNGATSGTPLLTLAELQARWGTDPIINIAVVIEFLTDHPGGKLGWTKGSLDAVVEIKGLTTTVASDTVAAYSDISTANNEWARIQGTGIANFAPLVGNVIHYTSGAASGMSAAIILSNPQAHGANTAEVNPPTTEPTLANNYGPTTANPTAGNTFDVVSVPLITKLILEVQDLGGNSRVAGVNQNRPAYITKLLFIQEFGAKANANGSRGRLLWCTGWNNWSDPTAANRDALAVGCFPQWTQSRMNPCNYQFSAMRTVAGINILFTYDDMFWSSVLFEGCGFEMQTGQIGASVTGVFNATGTGALVHNGCAFNPDTSLLGQGNTVIGLSVDPCGQVQVKAGTVLKLTGTGGDWRFGTGTAFTWAQAPRAHNQSSGTDTLGAGGTKSVTSVNLPADANITATCRTPAGAGAPGIYSIPTATRGASAFVVNSTVAAETSTFDWSWFSPGGGSGGVFNV